ncbi:hypothetical protein HYDPIDRAFT_86439 [Hydnomerulius pinastri MD-312]|nr:hypothetical protein HYDPIDRAFT_86439 [Hydnomerulius pinastri MD-312]
MTSDPSTTVPSWLTDARKEAHQRLVFAALSKREQDRDNARIASLVNTSTSSSRRWFVKPASLQEKNALSKHYSVAIGSNPNNQWGNRYSNVGPYDRTRVVVGYEGACTLGCGNSVGEGRYFNASWVNELYGEKLWIATQAPLPATAHAFLSAITQPIASPPSTIQGSRVRTVVQLTLNYESGRTKAHLYFPSTVGQSKVMEAEPGCKAAPLKVTLLEKKTIDEANCVQSKVSIVRENDNSAEPTIFTHLLYIAWPDHGVPEEEDEASLLRFLRLVDTVNKTPHTGDAGGDPDPPMIVNCSAGIGRTGSFIALSSLLRYHNLLGPSPPSPQSSGASSTITVPKSPLGPLPEEIANDLVAREIDNLREQRPGMVQRNEQISLVYQILEQGFLHS